MSDEEYSSDESSGEEDSQVVPKSNAQKLQELTLNDNDDDYDAKAFQRPNFNDIEIEGDYEEEEGEYGEDMSEFDESAAKKGSKGKGKLKADSVTSATSKADDDKNNKKKKKNRQLMICLTATKYDCVRRVAKKLNYKEVPDEEEWCLYWTDTSVSIDRVNQMKRWQKINHFPGMSEICRKDFLTRNMNRMAKLFPKEYNFYPKAWCLPADYADLSNYARQKKNKTYICKPDSGCQGRGIFITKNPFKDIKPGDNYVAQVYVSRPFTIDGYKFDLRVYVAVTSCDPFRIFVYREGLARFTTQAYEEPTQINCKDVFMHLTNYAIQKRSDDFIRDEDTGTKRRISTINKWLVQNGYDIDKMWSDVDDVIIKVLISAFPVLKHNYRTCFANHFRGSACFEILGFDVLIDKKMKPYVLEVNHSPSFTTDSKLDREIKDALIYDTIMLLNIGALDKKRCVEEERKRVRERLFLRQGRRETKEELGDIQQQWLETIEKWENKHIGNYRRIYPMPGTERYDKYYNNTGSLFSETAASKARLEQAKQQMEEIQRKNEKILGSKHYKANLTKEMRGESPPRKIASTHTLNNSTTNTANNYLSNKSTRQQSRNSLAPTSTTSNQNTSSQIKYRNTIQATTNSSMPKFTYIQVDTMKPLIIDENEELERIQALKQRDNLLKGMGINEFVHRILFGTPGTMATIPPPLNNLKPSTNNSSLPNNLLNLTNQNLQEQSQDMLQTKYVSTSTVYNNNTSINNNISASKLEIKTRNYNPFDNHPLFNEVSCESSSGLANTLKFKKSSMGQFK